MNDLRRERAARCSALPSPAFLTASDAVLWRMDIIKNLEAMLAAGQDSAMLRYTLGNTYLKDGALKDAINHLHQAVKLDHNYSAAWKSYAKALSDHGDTAAAIHAYETGIHVAEAKGDLQAAKEMKVFLKRLRKPV